MSALPSAPPVSIDEFEKMSAKEGIQELLDGAIIEVPPVKKRHSEIVKRLAKILERHIPESQIWTETAFLIGTNCTQPDVAVIHPGQGTARGWFHGAPMVAIEVASRGNTPEELERKKDLYLESGAHEVWVVYDRTRSVTVHRGADAVRHRGVFFSAALGIEISAAEILS